MSDLLRNLRSRTRNTGRAPSVHDIEEMANFREAGGLHRCLSALQAVAQEELQDFPHEKLTAHLLRELERIDDGDEPALYVGTARQLRQAIASFRP